MTIVVDDPKVLFSVVTTPFPGLHHFTLGPYLIMLSVKQGGTKYQFLSLCYDSTLDWTQVSRIIGEHSTFLANLIDDISSIKQSTEEHEAVNFVLRYL